jgi:hypothetical protein
MLALNKMYFKEQVYFKIAKKVFSETAEDASEKRNKQTLTVSHQA